jgi:hypothetical protein
MFMGNRGHLHGGQRRLVRQTTRETRWIACELSFKGVRRTVMKPGSYTELFFLDEPTALSAGHRPCAECRRSDYRRFLAAFQLSHALPERPKATEVDAILQPQRDQVFRSEPGSPVNPRELPDGVMVTLGQADADAWLIHLGQFRRWSHAGYGEVRPIDSVDSVFPITPPSLIRTIAAGYQPRWHPAITEPGAPT